VQNWQWKFTHKKQQAETPPDLTGKQATTKKIQALHTEIKLPEKFSGKAKNLGWRHCIGWPELICARSQWPQQLRFTGKKNSRAGKADRRQELKSAWEILWATWRPAQKMAKRLTEKDLLRRLKAGWWEAAKYPARKNQVTNEKIRSGNGCTKTNVFIVIHTSLQLIHGGHCPPSLIWLEWKIVHSTLLTYKIWNDIGKW
jgi:hypothetical protein